MMVSTAKIRKWLDHAVRELGFLKEEDIYVRDLGNTVAALRIYPSRTASHVYVDIGVVDLRFPHKPVKETPFWHFNARLQFLFEEGTRNSVVRELDRDSDIPISVRIETLEYALSVYDAWLKEKWQNENWLDSLVDTPESDKLFMQPDYCKLLLTRNRSREAQRRKRDGRK